MVLILLLVGGALLCASGVASAETQTNSDTFSGFVETTFHVSPAGLTFADVLTFETEILLDYTLGDTTFSTRVTLFSMPVIFSQILRSSVLFKTTTCLGPHMISSDLHFELERPESHFWRGQWEINAFGVTLSADALLVSNPDEPEPEDLRLDLSLVGQTVAGSTMEAVATFGDYVDPMGYGMVVGYAWPNSGTTDGVCDLSFTGVELAWSALPFCCAEGNVKLSYDCSGFMSAVFEVDQLGVESLPWLLLSTSLVLSPQTKTLTIRPVITLGESENCFFMQAALSYGANLQIGEAPLGDPTAVFSLGPFLFGLQCALGDVQFIARSAFNTATLILQVGGLEDAEAEDLKPEPCCSMMLSLMAVFTDTSSALFGLHALNARTLFAFGDTLTWIAGLTADVDQGIMSWDLGFRYTF